MQSEVQNKKTLTGHLKTHSTDKAHKCDSCDSAFTRKSNLTRHVLAAHTGPVFHCDICLAPFSYIVIELDQRLKALDMKITSPLVTDHLANPGSHLIGLLHLLLRGQSPGSRPQLKMPSRILAIRYTRLQRCQW